LKLLGKVRLLIAVTSSSKLFCGYSRFTPAFSSDGAAHVCSRRRHDNDGATFPARSGDAAICPINSVSSPSGAQR
jgi:hypothetical protein